MSRKGDRLKPKFNKTGNQNILTRYNFFRNKVYNLKGNAKEQFTIIWNFPFLIFNQITRNNFGR